MILTQAEIDTQVSQISGTWVKRKNLEKKLTKQSNNEVNEKIQECKGKIRDIRAMGGNEAALREWYSEVTKLELRLL